LWHRFIGGCACRIGFVVSRAVVEAMPVEGGDLAMVHYQALQQWNNLSVHPIFDSVALSDATGPMPTQDYASPTVMTRIIQVAMGRMTVNFPAQSALIPCAS
jgi:hypothetical protein